MSIHIRTNDNDDWSFINFVQNALFNSAFEISATEAVAIRIDNWFDHKWLKFSGIGVVEFPQGGINVSSDFDLGLSDSALEEFHRDKITFPPFAPNRIMLEEVFAIKRSKGKYTVHRTYKERSSLNLQRRIDQYSDCGVYLWFSSNTFQNGRGSLMVYTIHDNRVVTWYASFIRKSDWMLDRVKGVSRHYVENLLRDV